MIDNDTGQLLIFISALLVNNIVLMKFLALCSFFGVSNEMETSIGMGFAVVFVMVIASVVSWFFYHAFLDPNTVYASLHVPFLTWDLTFLRTASFIVVIASLVQLEEMFLKKYLPALYRSMGIYLPLITTNCAILGVAFLNIDYNLNLLSTVVYSLGVGFGYMLAIILFAGIRIRVDRAPIPQAFKGYPVAFITASLMSLAFLGFKGLMGL